MSENRSRRGFLYLPLELHLCIIEELDAPDLLNLGQTCNAIRSTINQRRVWEAALRATCRLNQLFEPSYHPIEDLDILELQRAALEPWRRSASFALGSRSDSPFRDEESAASRNVLRKKIKLESDSVEEFAQVYIVPGGRYVLAITGSCIYLWDLGQISKVPWDSMDESLKPTSITRATHGGLMWSMSAPKPVGITTFRFATSENATDLRVYEVGPLPDVCSIREIAKLQGISPELSLHNVWIQGNSLVCDFDEGGILVWDFVQSRYAAIPSRGEVAKITTNGNLIIAWQGPNVGVWTIPPLKPLETSSAELRDLFSEDFTGGIDFNTIPQDERSLSPAETSLPCAWYSFPPDAVEYAILHPDYDKKTIKVERVLLDVTAGGGSYSRCSQILFTMDLKHGPQDDEPYRTLCGSFATMVDQGLYPPARVGILHSVGDDARSKGANRVQHAFKDLGALDMDDFSYCPPTGRVAFIPFQNPPTSNSEIIIMSLAY
ncbi:hypothetical protein DFP72DRAFT_1163446 [Ephemerocybe angulata]|uniref:F-box domain-containing protein n=1 Tax=Ephemerocybe angulata TaxID=980116 RepID=A0A8H6IHH9_9AGAR|nr:hypothetical protein DFP72DRAFT_1163446 [Tulosesus angulatus]